MRIVRLLLSLACLGVFLVVGAGTVLPAGAQTTAANEWTWMGGLGTLGSGSTAGVYGTLGSPAAANIPGSRAYGVGWTDSKGNIWLFGGFGASSTPNWSDLNDLWMLNPATAQWTWMGGSSTGYQSGVYGTLQSPATGNYPGARHGATGWTDSKGNFWLFGGTYYDTNNALQVLNDLWMFNPSTSEWAWMGGTNAISEPGVYGTLGTPASTNVPGGRAYAVSWIDKKGNFWVYGGYALDSTGTFRSANDLWEFNPSTNEWTWMNGSNTISDVRGQPGVYGALGTAVIGNTPGSRAYAVSWADGNGNLWLFGGYGPDSTGTTGFLNDLWEFDTAASEWKWVGGSSTFDGYGGLPGQFDSWMAPAPGNYPGGRQSAISWTDSSGNFWLYGGAGVDSVGETGELNDLWEYSPSTNQWTWMGGTTTLDAAGYPQIGPAPVQGILQTPNLANNPGGLESSTGWTDGNGNLWLFGGGYGFRTYGFLGYVNNLWEYQPGSGSLPVTATPNLSLNTGTYSAGQTLTISDSTPNASIYYFVSGAGAPVHYTNPITISSTESVEVVAVAPGYSHSNVAAATLTVPITDAPTFSVAPGSYSTAQTVSLADATSGAVIYYAINATPTTNSSVYSGAITVSSSETIEAIAVAPGSAVSPTSTANYTIWPASMNGEWAWMGGAETQDLYGVWGILGTAAPANIPGSRASAASWTDLEGNFWLFGGVGVDASGANPMILNDLWEFNSATNEWVWWAGSQSAIAPGNSCLFSYCGQPGNYGTLGVPSRSNIPGARDSASTWIDSSGNFWLFGGSGFDSQDNGGLLNDLWKFDPSTLEWTWVGGSDNVGSASSQSGVYGTLGQGAAANIPGGRANVVSWVDTAGHVWLFGGEGPGPSAYNDLWEYDPSSNEWAWMGGDTTACVGYVQSGVWGNMGAPAPGNVPSCRYGASGWSDRSGNFWLFGGAGRDIVGDWGDLNSLWEFNPSTKQWAWMGGGDLIGLPSGDQPGQYGTLGTPAAGNIPASRWDAASWTDSGGNLWLFAGHQSGAFGLEFGLLDDLWEFNPTANEWTWMGGSYPIGSLGVYGAQGVPAPSNIPGARSGSSNWADSGGNFWLFGGTNAILYERNDVWKYVPSAAPAPVPGFALVDLNNQILNSALSFEIGAGSSGTTPINTVVAGGFGGTIVLSAVGLPSGISASFSPSSITGFGVSQVTFSVGSNVAPGNYTLTLAGASGGVTETTTVLLTVISGGPAAATPLFSVAAGTYSTNQSVAINDATSGATIYYTTNGTTPTTGSTVYSGPIQVMSTETIEALAAASGYSTSAVATATYTIPQSFSLSMNPTSMTVTAGASGSTTVTVQDEGGFNGNVSFACSGLPAGAGCSFTTLTVPTAAGVSYTTLTVTTSSTTAEVRRGAGALLPGAAMAVVVCCFGLRRRRRLLMLVLLGVGLAGLGVLGGCGSAASSGGGGGGGTQPVTSTVTVTATSGTLTQTATFTLTVN